MSIIERLVHSVRSAAAYNSNVQAAPACILWPDRERQWESVLPRLREAVPELLVLGEYAPLERTGPAIWLRCAIAGTLVDMPLPEGHIPIIYLPGVGRQDLRAVESCPDNVKALAELQYRGSIWSQVNAKDWTLLAFLKSDQGGLGLDVAQDNETKEAMQLALYRLLDEEPGQLAGRRLDTDYFNTLVTGDPVRELLLWLDRGEAFSAGRGHNEWTAFVNVCESRFGYNPEMQGPLEGVARLAAHQGPWQVVWDRFCEAPARYPDIPGAIRRCRRPVFELFGDALAYGGWPQWNDEQEDLLRAGLVSLARLTPQVAVAKLEELERDHGDRRALVWAELGEAPLAMAMEHLTVMVGITQRPLGGTSAEELAAAYRTRGWRADDAAIRALALAEKPQDVQAVTGVIRELYAPWAEEGARRLQHLVDGAAYPGGSISSAPDASYNAGECLLFVDGLRYDCARRLVELLRLSGCEVQERGTWAALPSVTATGKPAVTPVRKRIHGAEANADFEPSVAATGQSLKGGYHLKKLLGDEGWQVLGPSDNGDTRGNAWCEFGDIDQEGHNRGWKVARQLENLLNEIRERVLGLLGAGWRSVHVVTDHGWLLMPGGLAKIELPGVLTESRGGRCAAVKADAVTNERFYPWFWNPDVEFALADGISCFRNGMEYAHGGLSLQECVTLEIMVTSETGGAMDGGPVIANVVWRGLRCTVVVEGSVGGLTVDIRRRPAIAASSVVVVPRPLKIDGTGSVVVENEDLEGSEATVVLFGEGDRIAAQVTTVIGGGSA
ncbi:MAG: BREX-1 system phosphatase PglZ type B [Bacteroidetes bacterium]|nr:BREX-1 system phosphatase PglZ type B [Bacteroidota bacterium]